MNEVVSNEYSQTHQALDIVSADHTPTDIIALDSGIVESVVKNIPSTDHETKGLATYGNYVKIKQNNGKSALYAHMKYGSVNVNIGDYVEKGAIIGTMGNTGNAYGNHLHLEVKNQNNINENPIISLNEKTTEIEEIKQDVEIPEENITTSQPQTIETEKSIENINTQIKEDIHVEDNEYLSSNYTGTSIVDGLKSINIDSSYDYRQMLAEKNDITNYHGSYEQNIKLLNLLKEGKLKKA